MQCVKDEQSNKDSIISSAVFAFGLFVFGVLMVLGFIAGG